MKWYVPDYYKGFHCTADRCRHTCCAGWEIDVDEDTAAWYHSLKGPLGDRLRNHLAMDDEGTCHFCLGKDEKCPMLRDDGLCEIICELGEDALCQVCADHPRWRNFFSDRTETGLGLCCEAAAELILHRREPVRWLLQEDDGEEDPTDSEEYELLKLREQLTRCLQDRDIPMEERIDAFAELIGAREPVCTDETSADLLAGLERLDPLWEEKIHCLRENPRENLLDEPEAEQFAVYLLNRHLPGALEDGLLTERAMFAIWGMRLVMRLADGKEDIAETARMFSSEIEYSDENMTAILRYLGGRDEPDAVL